MNAPLTRGRKNTTAPSCGCAAWPSPCSLCRPRDDIEISRSIRVCMHQPQRLDAWSDRHQCATCAAMRADMKAAAYWAPEVFAWRWPWCRQLAPRRVLRPTCKLDGWAHRRCIGIDDDGRKVWGLALASVVVDSSPARLRARPPEGICRSTGLVWRTEMENSTGSLLTACSQCVAPACETLSEFRF